MTKESLLKALEDASHTEVFHGSGAQKSVALHKAIALVKEHLGDAATVLSRIPKAIEELESQIDGGEECRGRDSQISYVINILEGTAP